jgi:hypothetical protein
MKTGSLRIIQNGADFQTLAVIENIRNFSKIWPIRNRFRDSYVVFSTVHCINVMRSADMTPTF